MSFCVSVPYPLFIPSVELSSSTLKLSTKKRTFVKADYKILIDIIEVSFLWKVGLLLSCTQEALLHSIFFICAYPLDAKKPYVYVTINDDI